VNAAPGDRPCIRIEGVSKRFGDTIAVDNLSLDIGAGEFCALLGPSGCGKTTLLRLLAGFERPDAGRLLIDGIDMTAVPPYARPVNMMFQSYALFPHMTVEQNVAFGLKQERLPRRLRADRVAAALDLVQMRALGGRRPHQLSGGQRQRVALARAIAKEPKVLLLDEPLSALDRKLREATRFELAAIQRRLGITFVMVTHDQEEAMTLADSMAVMDAGRILQSGPPAEVYEYPASRFVGEFLGLANLYDGKLVLKSPQRAEIRCEALGINVVADRAVAAPIGTAVQVAVRPEKILLSVPAPFSPMNAVEGRVAEVAYQGDRSLLKVALARGTTMHVTVANIDRAARGMARGQSVWLSWPASSVVVLGGVT
jgi:putrescine transport system ATP-binding protein